MRTGCAGFPTRRPVCAVKPLDLTAARFNFEAEAEIIERWWREVGIEPLPRAAMPRIGRWAMHGENRMACAFAYLMDDTKLVMIALPIANPSLDWRRQAEALAYAVSTLADEIREKIADAVIIALSHDNSVHQTYVKRAGFRDTGKIHLAVSAPAGVDIDILSE